jgi:hypothetical protein
MSILSVAVAAGVAGCGDAHAPAASNPSGVTVPSPSTPPVDPNAAFAQFDKAAKPYECSSTFQAMYDAAGSGDSAAMKDNAGKYREEVAAWDHQMRTIAFPVAVQPIVARIWDDTAAELTALNELATADVKDAERVADLESQVEVADASVGVEDTALRAALGHPEPAAGVAVEQFQLAYVTFFRETGNAKRKREAAVAANDLAGAKAANVAAEDAAQAYIDRLGTIDWPAGFDDQLRTLRASLRALIEFDRHQVDVATATQIDPAPGAEAAAAENAKDALWNALVKEWEALNPETKCKS